MSTAFWRGGGFVALVALAVVASAPVEAADTPSVSISVDAKLVYPPRPPGAYYWFAFPRLVGTFEASGDIADEGVVTGTYRARYIPVAGPFGTYYTIEYYWQVSLAGDHGTLHVSISAPPPILGRSPTWTVTGGTGDYAEATGGGTSTLTVTNVPRPAPEAGYDTYYDYTLTGSVDA